MPREFQFQVSPEVAANESLLAQHVAKLFQVSPKEIQKVDVLKRSIDARQKAIKMNIKANVFLVGEEYKAQKIELPDYPNVANKQEVIVVGAGPAGLFAALQLIELGLKPIVLERGKDVRGRRRDLKAINVDHIVNEDSNYCFGEGGAGTYSDGKLYTRSKKRGDIDRILALLVGFGATPDIMVEAHPHIGTNKLPQIIQDIREKIIECGGQVLFETRVTDFVIKNNEMQGVVVQNGDVISANKVVLATGHSARDIFELLHKKGVHIEAKPFALGVRAEHPQELIDRIQYSCDFRGDYLPPAPYSIVKQVNGRGMYSFCMCPGGVIAPCATSPGEVVTNGWGLGIDYDLGKRWSLGSNVSYNAVKDAGGLSNYQLGFNTPEYRTNVSLGNRNIGNSGWGFNATWRYQDQFVWQSSFVNQVVNQQQLSMIPAFSTLDMQVSKKVSEIKSIIKVGGTNLGGVAYTTGWGNPLIGSMYYVSITFDELLNK